MPFPANRRITESFPYHFRISESGVYAVSITAHCRSGEQIGKRGSEDLQIEIDGKAFREIPPAAKPQYQDIPASWNGTRLKGLRQTIIFILHLQAGRHSITFIPQESAVIETEPRIQLVNDPADIEFQLEEQAEDGDRRPWLTFAFIDLPVRSFSIDTSVRWHWRNGDDIKLVIDNEIRKNTSPLAVFHRHWLWSAFPFRNKRQEKTFSPALPTGIHYIELWADRKPILHRARFNLSQNDSSTNVDAHIVWESVKLRPAPRIGLEDFGDIPKNERVVVLKKAVVGDKVVTPNGSILTTDRWHKVRYGDQEGYVYSLALEVDGEDKQSIRELIIQKSQELGEYHCLMIGVAERESRLFPYEVSDKGAQGIFQLKEDAVKDVNKTFQKNFSNRFDVHQNIEAGILYFQLVKKRYEGKDYFWERCLAAWNRGWHYVAPNKPFIFAKQPVATRQFIRDVFRLWDDCKKTGSIFMVALLAVGVILISGVSIATWKNRPPEQFMIPDAYAHDVILRDQKVDINSDGKEERLVVVNDNPHSTFGTTKVLLMRMDNSFVKLPDEGDEFQWIKTGDFNRNGLMDIAILYGYSGSAGFGHFYIYEWSKDAFKTLLAREDISSEVDFQDTNNDGIQEIIYRFRPLKWSRGEKDIYRWQKEKMAYEKLPRY